ncbi:MAG: TetR/AcrR family transcriptional regulator [Myxococcota bacterium]
MGRQSGAVNRDHDQKRAKLAESLAHALLKNGGGGLPSLKTMAEEVGVDAGTLRHYFDDREGAVRAAFESLLPYGEVQKTRAAELAKLPVREALHTLLTRLVQGWPTMLGAMHAAGFSEGMANPELGQAYVASMLEPTLDTVEKLLVVFHTRGELHAPEPRVAGLALLAPLMFALFHQHQLSGRRCRPLELTTFVEAHLDGFLRGYAARGVAS